MKKVLFKPLICVFCFAFLFLFASCGETRSYSEVANAYNQMISSSEYEQFFHENNIKITYSQSIQQRINSASSADDDLFYNLTSSYDLNRSTFEPILYADCAVVNYFINLGELNYSSVSADILNTLYSNITSIKEALLELDRAKKMLENGSNPDDWVENYRKELYNTIVCFNAFAQNYIFMFETYVNNDTSPGSRLSVAKTQLQYAKKLLDSADFFTRCTLKDYITKSYTKDENSCNEFLRLYVQAEDVFGKRKFQDIQTEPKSDEESSLIVYQNYISKYDSLYYNNLGASKEILKSVSYADLESKKVRDELTDQERIYYNKINSFLHDQQIMFGYFEDFTYGLIQWDENN